MTPAQRRLIVPIFALGLALVLLVATAWITLMNRPTSTGGAGAVGGSFALINHDGGVITDRDMRGKPFLIFFGFTHCPDVCPAALMEISQVLEAMGPDAKISALFVSIDPERDTPAALKDYVSNFDKRIIGVTGPRESINAVAKAYRVYHRKVPGENGEYTMDHSTVTYLMDRRGQFVNAVNLQRPAKDVAAELKPHL
jgi:protein SCO1